MNRSAVVCLVVLLALPGAVQAQAGADWWTRAREGSSRFYDVKSDIESDVLRGYVDHLDRMFAEYTRRFARMEVREQVKPRVYLFAKQADYVATLRDRFDIDGRGSGGMFFVTQRGRGLAVWTGDLGERRVQHVIQHEGFHQFAYTRFGNDLPLWVNEGLAEYFGRAVLVGKRLVIGLIPEHPLHLVREAARGDAHLKFERLLTMNSEQWRSAVLGGSAELQYAQSWSIVHFLVDGADGKYRRHFERYLHMLNEGRPPREAFDVVFGADVDAFEDAWRKALEEQTSSAFLDALDRMDFLAEGALAVSRAGERPETLEDLRTALAELGFESTTVTHGVERTMQASDAALFELPAAGGAPAPVFVLDVPKRRVPRHFKAIEEEEPTPADIRTEGLEPKNLEVRWERDRKTKVLRYRIVAK